jgi:hypothetical protein
MGVCFALFRSPLKVSAAENHLGEAVAYTENAIDYRKQCRQRFNVHGAIDLEIGPA